MSEMPQLKPDENNANAGTERGRALLEKSVRSYGAGRPGCADANDVMISGNKRLEVMAELDIPVRVIETDGSELIVVRRTDLNLQTDRRARELAYAENRVGEVSRRWDPSQLADDLSYGLPLDDLFTPSEIEDLLPQQGAVEGPEKETKGRSSTSRSAANETTDMASTYSYDLVFDTLEQQTRWNAFLKFLRSSYPDETLLASCLDRFVTDKEADGAPSV